MILSPCGNPRQEYRKKYTQIREGWDNWDNDF